MVEEALLRDVPLLEGLDAAGVKLLVQYFTRKDYAEGEVIFSESSSGQQLYIIKSGAVRISKIISGKDEQNLALLRGGEFFGELSLLDDKPHTANAVAWKDSQILTIGREQFERFLAQEPVAGYQLLSRILVAVCRMLRQMDEKFIDMIKFVWEFGAKT